MKNLRTVGVTLACVVMCVQLSGHLWGQTAVGSIVGTVRDATGGVVPGAKVTISNMMTNTSREATTNSVGDYAVPYLPPGKYQVTGEAAGFQRTVVPDLTLLVNQVMRIDIELRPGAVTEKVTVEATAPQLKTQSTEVSAVITRREVHDLPLNGRNFVQLALLTEAVYRPAEGTGSNNQVELATAGTTGVAAVSANGLRDHYSTATLDGTNIYNLANGYIGMFPSTDAIQEFSIVTGNNSADFGRVAGASMNLTLRQGTNSFHGSVYEFLRNDNLDAADFFSPPGKKPEFRRNQFGFVVAGPVIRDRTFFMANYEGLRQQKPTVSRVLVPTPTQLSGDLSGFATPIIDPLTGSPFPGNIIPANRIAAPSLKLASFYPEPNTPGSPNFTTGKPGPLNTNGGNFRVDHVFSPHDTFFASYSFVDLNSAQSPTLPAFVAVDAIRQSRGSVSYAHIFSPQFVMNARMGVFRIGNTNKSARSNGEDLRPFLGINYPTNPANYGVPIVSIAGYAGLGDQRSFRQPQTTFEPSVDFTRNVRSHIFKFGFSYIGDQKSVIGPELGMPSFTFTGAYTQNALADFLLGYLKASSRFDGPYDPYNRQYHLGAYLGDTWRATSKLTFNLGLRYDFNSPFTEPTDGHIASFTQSTGLLEYPANCADCPAGQKGRFGNAVIASYKRDWGPRVGLAYQLSANTVMRAAYGIYWNPEFSAGNESGLNTPFIKSFGSSGSPGIPDLTWANPFQAGRGGTLDIVNGREQNWQDGYVQQWNIALERQLRGNFLITASYIGNKGTHLPWSLDVNTLSPEKRGTGATRPYPTHGNIQVNKPQGTSNYHGLGLRAQKTFSGGLGVLATYTWGKALSRGAESLFGAGKGGFVGFPQDSYNLASERGLSLYDVAHKLSIGYIWEIPVGKGKRWLGNVHPVIGQIVGGWEISGITAIEGGIPFSVQSITAQPGDLAAIGFLLYRADLVGNPRVSKPTINRWFNTDAFRVPAPLKMGNSGSHILRGPGQNNWDVAVFKNFTITGEKSLQFRTEFFNLPNHPQFGLPSWLSGNLVESGNFGKITTTGFFKARSIQFGLRFTY